MWIAKRCKVFTFACPQLGTSWCQAVENSSFGMEGARSNWSLKSLWFLMRKNDISFLLVCFVFNPPQDSSALKTLQIEKLRGKLILQSDSSDFTRSQQQNWSLPAVLMSWIPSQNRFFVFSLSNSPPFQLPRSWQAVSCSMICESRRERRSLLPSEIKLGMGAQHEQWLSLRCQP